MTETNKLKESIRLTDTLDIPELSFRHFRGEVDYPLMLAVMNKCKQEDGEEYTQTLEDLALQYANLDNCDPFKDMLFAEVRGEVIGFSRVSWSQKSSGEYIYRLFGMVLPECRRKGIGTAMLHHDEDRLRQIAHEHPSESPKFFQSWASEGEVALLKLMDNENYQPIRYFFEMARPTADPIPEAPMPDGLEVRPVPEAEYRKLAAAADEAFRDHWGHAPFSEKDYQRWVNDPKFNPTIWKVAWDGDNVAGMVLNFVDAKENEEYQRKRGYTEVISVRRPYRKRGLAKSLIAQSIAMFREMGMEETALDVDTKNLSGALKLYEDMGYHKKKRFTVFRKPLE